MLISLRMMRLISILNIMQAIWHFGLNAMRYIRLRYSNRGLLPKIDGVAI